MIHPARAIVVPRVFSPSSPEPLPIEDTVLAYYYSSVRTIRLTGRGKTTALQHLADVIGDHEGIVLLDDQSVVNTGKFPDAKLIVFHATSRFKADVNLAIAPWTQDDVIEFLLAKHGDRCKSVMARLTTAGDSWIADGDPCVWSLILPQMADNEGIGSVQQAIRQTFGDLLQVATLSEFVTDVCFEHIEKSQLFETDLSALEPVFDSRPFRLLGCQGVRFVLVADKICKAIKYKSALKFFERLWPSRLYELVAREFNFKSTELDWLSQIANLRENKAAAVAASLMLQIDCSWQPKSREPLWYTAARLKRASWQNVNLAGAELSSSFLLESDLRNANLSGATATAAIMTGSDMSDADLSGSRFHRASLSKAILQRAKARQAGFTHADLSRCVSNHADFEEADFSGADLTGSDFRNANFRKSKLIGTLLDETDFTGAELDGAFLRGLDFNRAVLDFASFSKASISYANFESTRIRNATFISANCQYSLFTDSQFVNVDMAQCNLRFAKLANVDWEGCNLAGADLSYAVFHLGSTRCGLVDSPYPSHGTRTGFYTDDYDEHYFRRPEEIRKANLCGCDLTGANVLATDFYLVDLRAARFGRAARDHFQSCGAILS